MRTARQAVAWTYGLRLREQECAPQWQT
jgi:hypothetical protein